MNLSVIIPIGENEKNWMQIFWDLSKLTEKDEIICVYSKRSQMIGDRNQLRSRARKVGLKCPFVCKVAQNGRAAQMNHGAKFARNQSLWFLHCDSRFSKKAVVELRKSMEIDDSKVLYFPLKFQNDGPWLMRFNTAGVWLRSRMLSLPFGDQGFSCKKSVFKKLGGFDVTVAYGEDHLFIWKAHHKGVKLRCLIQPIHTSARRYKINGWLETTLAHIALTYWQAFPEFVKLTEKTVENFIINAIGRFVEGSLGTPVMQAGHSRSKFKSKLNLFLKPQEGAS